MAISKATINDVTELAALVNSAYRGESSRKGWTTEAHLLDGSRIDEETITNDLKDPNATILKYVNDSGKIIGSVYLQNRGEKIYLGMLTVSPDLQAGGIGRQLLQAAEEYAREKKCPLITMTVITTRLELISWYERRGYKKTEKILPFHVDKKFGIPKAPIELVVMEKEI